MSDEPEISEKLLNQILVPCLYTDDIRKPSSELIALLARLTGKTELIINRHYKELTRLYKDGRIDYLDNLCKTGQELDYE